MKLRTKLAAITAAAMLAFAGVGFASWTFQNTVQTQDVTVTPEITCAVELNDDFKLFYDADNDASTADTQLSTLYLICDAPASLSGVLAGHGVYWSTANDNTAWANRVEGAKCYILGSLNYEAYDIEDLTSVTVSFAKGDNYALANGTYIEFADATINDVVVSPVADDAEVKTAKFALPVPSYNSSVNATNFNDITDVANITAGLGTLKIAYEAQITAKAE